MDNNENKNLLTSIIELYKESVDKQDAKGTAEVFKKASEIIFHNIEEYLHDDNINVNFSDIEYLDGYFIFGHGTNSIVQYHIDECPGWKFGIWFSEDEERKNIISYQWFAQYEETIDKFKPSASMISVDNKFNIDSPSENLTWKICSHIKFIHKHPELAYYRDVCYCDFNTEYVAEEEAIEFFNNERKT